MKKLAVRGNEIDQGSLLLVVYVGVSRRLAVRAFKGLERFGYKGRSECFALLPVLEEPFRNPGTWPTH